MGILPLAGGERCTERGLAHGGAGVGEYSSRHISGGLNTVRLACAAECLGGGGKKDTSCRAFEEPLRRLGGILISFPWRYFGAVLLFLSIHEKERRKRREVVG